MSDVPEVRSDEEFVAWLDRVIAGLEADLAAAQATVAGALKEQMPTFCATCGTSGPPEVIESSRVHRAHLARGEP